MTVRAIHTHLHDAMATKFELRIATDDTAYAHQAAQESFLLIDRIESLLSRFDANSEVSCIARLEPGETLRLSADTFACLRLAVELHAATGGAFDPTLGATLDRRRGQGPLAGDVRPGGRLLLDEVSSSVQVVDGAVALDLGAIGKGYALDRVAALLHEWEVDRALLVSGGSSLLALDRPGPGVAWHAGLGEAESTHRIPLERLALGASGTAVKGDHILNPLTGEPARGALRAWAVAPTAAEADALSTAWMNMSLAQIADVCRNRKGTGAVVLPRAGASLECLGELPPLVAAAGKS